MSREIDERVVQMKFDNGQFEEGAKETMSTLEKLKEKLKFSGASAGIEDVTRSIKGVDVSSLGDAVETVTERFSAMGIVATTALMNITNRAVDAGISLVKSLTVDNISSGFDKYQEALSSTQKMITNLPEASTEEIQTALEKIRWFTDETSYDYQALISNMSTFVSSGVDDINVAADAMIGVAGLAGLAGVEASQATHAFTGFAKALGAGKMTSDSWTWLHTAGMDTALVKQQFIDTAVELGKLKDNLDGTYTAMDSKGKEVIVTAATLQNTLSSGWLDYDVLTQVSGTMGAYPSLIYDVQNALSELSGEYVECSEAMDMFSEEALKDIDETSPQVQAYIKVIEDTTGETLSAAQAIEELGNLTYGAGKKGFEAAQKYRTFDDALNATKTAVTGAWSGIFEAIFGNVTEAEETWSRLGSWMWSAFAEPFVSLEEVVKEWSKAGGRDELIEAIANLGKTFTNEEGTGYLDAIKTAFAENFGVLDADVLFRISDAFASFTEKLIPTEDTLSDIADIASTVFNTLDFGVYVVKTLFDVISPVKDLFDFLAESIYNVTFNSMGWYNGNLNLIRQNDGLGKSLSGVKNFIQQVVDKLIELGRAFGKKLDDAGIKNIGDLFDLIGEKIKGVKEKFDEFKDKISNGMHAIAESLQLESLKQALSESGINDVGDVFEKIGGIIGGLIEGFKNFKKTFSETIEFVVQKLDLSGVSGLFDGIVKVLKGAWEIVKELIGMIIGGFEDLSGNSSMKQFIDNIQGLVGAIAGISVEAAISNLSWTLAGLGETIQAYAWQFEAGGILEVAEALAILVASLWVLSTLDTDKMMDGVVTIGALFAELAAAFNTIYGIDFAKRGDTMGSIKGALTSFVDDFGFQFLAAGIQKMATAILILSAALYVISQIDTDKLFTALGAMELIFLELGAFLKSTAGLKNAVSGINLIGLAASMLVLAEAVSKFGELEAEKILKGIVSMGVVMFELQAFLKATQAIGGMLTFGLGLIEIGAAMLILGSAVEKFGSMDYAVLAVGLTSFAAALVILAGGLSIMPNGLQVAAVGLGLIEVAAALNLIVPVLKALGSMNVGEILKSCITLGVVLAELAVGVTAMSLSLVGAAALVVVSAALIALASALIMMGTISWGDMIKNLLILATTLPILVAAGAAATLAAPGLLALAAAIVAIGAAFALIGTGVLAFAAALDILAALPGIVGASLTTIGLLITQLAESFLTAIYKVVPGLVTMVGELFGAIIQAVYENLPKVIDILWQLLNAVLTFINDYSPQIITSAMTLLLNLLTSVAEYVPQFADLALETLMGILKIIEERIPEFIEEGVTIILALLSGIVKASVDLINGATQCIIDLINGLANTIRTNTPLMIAAMDNLMSAVLEAMGAWLTHFFDKGAELLEKIVDGILGDGTFQKIKDAAGAQIKAFIEAVDSFKEKVKETARNLMAGFVDGIKEKAQAVKDAVTNGVKHAIEEVEDFLGIASPSKLMREIGRYTMEGFALGAKDESQVVSDAVLDAINPIQSMADQMRNALDEVFDYEPVITPRLDTSMLRSGFNSIDSMFSKNFGISGTPEEGQNGGLRENGGFSFVQNNYSPKALSRTEIYRQTKNQFAMMKEVVNGI